MKEVTNAIIYFRVSTDEQADKGFSLRHQKDVLKQYCKIKGIKIVASFQEDYSAKNFEDRPEWHKLEKKVRSNKRDIDQVLFTKWDRFSRNAEQALKVIREFEELGIEVNSVEQPLDLSNPDNYMMLSFYLMYPEVENRKNSIRTREGMRRAMSEGCFTGIAPYGYLNTRNEDGKSTLEPLPSHARLVEKAFQQFSSGRYKVEELRQKLMEEGYGGSKQSIRNLLSNPVYAGKILIKAWKKDPERIIEGLHPAIISWELYLRVQDILSNRRSFIKKPSKNDENFPLRGYLICPECGGNWTGSFSRSQNKTRHPYYHCQKKCKVRVRAEKVNSSFEGLLNSLTFSKEIVELYQEIIKDVFKTNEGDRDKEIELVKAEISKLTERLNKVQDKFFDDQIVDEEYYTVKDRYNQEIIKLKSKIQDLEDLETGFDEYINCGMDMLSNLQFYYSLASIDNKQGIIGSVFPEKLVFEKGNYRTTSMNSVLSLLCDFKNNLGDKKQKKPVNTPANPTRLPFLDSNQGPTD